MGNGSRWAWGWLVATIIALTGTARADESAVPEEARSHFKVGVSYLNDPAGPRYEDALREFSAAHAAAPSSWKTLNNIGLCALNLERDQEAIEAYEQALALAGSEGDAKWREGVERDIATLKAGLVRVTITVRPVGTTLLDERLPTSGKPVLNRYESPSGSFELGIHAGHHRVTASHGDKSDRWEFDAEAGAKLSHEFSLESAPAQAEIPPGAPSPAPRVDQPAPVSLERRTPVSVYVGAAVTGALAIGAGVTGALALGKHDDFKSANTGANPARAASLRSSGKDLGLASDILVGGAVLAAVGTAVLYFTRPTVRREQPTARIRIAPSVGPGGGWVIMTGRF
jgi:hypothetical protein